MPSIRDLFRLAEMARPRGDATWAVLDWAAQQPGTFTIKDLYKVYQQAGGEQGYTSFHTTVGHMMAKPWKDDQEKYALSDRRPFEVAKQGSRGAGGTTVLRWGLDRPLREPQEAEPETSDEQGAYDDAMDRLAGTMERKTLQAALARWKTMEPNQAALDIRKTVPRRAWADAFHVVMAELERAGSVTPDQSAEAEADFDAGRLPDAPGATSQAPKAPPKHSPPPPPEPEPEEPEVHAGSEPEQPKGGLTIPRQFFDRPEDAGERNPGREQEPAKQAPPPERKKSSVAKFFRR